MAPVAGVEEVIPTLQDDEHVVDADPCEISSLYGGTSEGMSTKGTVPRTTLTQAEVDHDSVHGRVEEADEHRQSHGDHHAHHDTDDPHPGQVHPLGVYSMPGSPPGQGH